MNRAVPVIVAAVVVAAISCQEHVTQGPPPCMAIAPPPDVPGLPSDTVWGFADLHAHPAIERAFGGRLIWGSAIDEAPVNASELPMIASCPVETHDHDAASPIDHEVGSLVFPQVAQIGPFRPRGRWAT